MVEGLINHPLGLITRLTTTGMDNGRSRITLVYKPNNTALDVKERIMTVAGGEVDISFLILSFNNHLSYHGI